MRLIDYFKKKKCETAYHFISFWGYLSEHAFDEYQTRLLQLTVRSYSRSVGLQSYTFLFEYLSSED